MIRPLARISCVGVVLCVLLGSLFAQGDSSSALTGPATNSHLAQESTPGAPHSDPTPNTAPVEASVQPANPPLAPPPKRMFGMIPDFENTNDTEANRRPLTIREKYILSLHQSFDISAHVGNAFQAGLQQAANGQPHYGQGWNAYGKRFAANEADQVSSSILIYGVFPSLLHDDPRYFRQGRGPLFSRVWYAINRTLVTRRDKGTYGFNTSQVVGQLISCAISTSYYPAQDRTTARVFSNWGVNLGGNSAYNVLSEYYPDMMRAIFRRHPQQLHTAGN
jgi:hypothetical protein